MASIFELMRSGLEPRQVPRATIDALSQVMSIPEHTQRQFRSPLTELLAGATHNMATLPQRAIGAAGDLQRTGDADLSPVFDTAMNMVGLPGVPGMAGVPRGALGSSVGSARVGGMGDLPKELYHVAGQKYKEGNPLRSLYAQHGDKSYDMFAKRWPDAGDMSQDHAHRVFFYENLNDAKEHASSFGGKILKVDPSKVHGLERDRLEVNPYKKGSVGYWVTREEVPSEALSPFANPNSAAAGIGPARGDVTLGSGANSGKGSLAQLMLGGVRGIEQPQGIRAYHGSPHDFDRFDMSKIGTGEGAQAYGHGLYFAESEPVAKSYRDAFVKPYYNQNDANSWALGAMVQNKNDKERAIADLTLRIKRAQEQDAPALADKLKQSIGMIERGEVMGPRMYEVNIRAQPEQFLDWDRPVGQQSNAVQDVAKQLGIYGDTEIEKGIPWLTRALEMKPETGLARGQDMYRRMAQGEGFMFAPEWAEASTKLKDAGIPGIKYLDQGSRTTGQGTSNYVLFRDDIIDILRKYGIAAPVAAPAMAPALGGGD